MNDFDDKCLTNQLQFTTTFIPYLLIESNIMLKLLHLICILYQFNESLSFIVSTSKFSRTIHRFLNSIDSIVPSISTDKLSFRDLYSDSIPSWLLNRCEELGYIYPTPTQLIALPTILNGSDCILQSQVRTTYIRTMYKSLSE
jgi:hypothetical protein